MKQGIMSLTPHARLELYYKIIILEAKGTLKKMTAGTDDFEIGLAELEAVSKHCIARTWLLIEKIPEDREQIEKASQYANQIIREIILAIHNADEKVMVSDLAE